MDSQGKRKYWKGLLYSTTVIAMLGTPVSALAAVTQNLQSEQLTKEQDALLAYEQAIKDYDAAKEAYTTARGDYEAKISRYNELSLAVQVAKTAAEEAADALQDAKDAYTPVQKEYASVKQQFEDAKQEFTDLETSTDYLAKKQAFDEAKQAYTDLSGPYETALATFNDAKQEYYDALDKYEALQEELRGTDGTSGLMGEYTTAKTAYDNAFNIFNSARRLFNTSKKTYEDAITEYNGVLRDYELEQETYKGVLAKYEANRELYANNKAAYEAQIEVLAELKTEYTTAENIYNTSLQTYKDKNDDYVASVNTNQPIIDAYKDKVEQYEKDLAALQGELDAYNKEIETHEGTVTAYENSKVAYEKIVIEYQETTKQLEEAKKAYEANIAVYDKAQTDYNLELETYNQQKDTYKTSLATFSVKLDNYNKELASYKEKYEAAEKILNDYAEGTAEYTAAKKAYDENKALYDTTYAIYVNVQAEASKLTVDFNKVNEAFQQRTDAFTAIQNQYATLKDEYGALVIQKGEQEELYTEIKGQYDTATKAYEEIQNEYERLVGKQGTVNGKINDLNQTKATLDTEYITANAALTASKDAAIAASEAYKLAEEDYGVAFGKYTTANNKALELIDDKEKLDAEFSDLTTELGTVNDNLTTLNNQKLELEGKLSEANADSLPNKYKAALALRNDAEEKLGLATTALAAANTAVDNVNTKIREANKELNEVIQPKYEDVSGTFADLEDRYKNQVLPAYNAAKALYDPLYLTYTDLRGKYDDLDTMLTDGSELMTKYTAAKGEYSDLTGALDLATEKHEAAVKAVDDFNSDPEVIAIKGLYKDAKTKYGLMETALAAAQEAVAEYNGNLKQAEAYVKVMDAYEKAKTAMNTIQTEVLDPLDAVAETYPIESEQTISRMLGESSSEFPAQIAEAKIWQQELEDWYKTYNATLTKSKANYTANAAAVADIAAYQAAFQEYRESGIVSMADALLPLDPANYISNVEAFLDTNVKDTDRNEIIIDAYLEISDILLNEITPLWEAYNKALKGETESGYSYENDFVKWADYLGTLRADYINDHPNDLFAFVGEEYASIDNYDEWASMIATYENAGKEIAAGLDEWMADLTVIHNAYKVDLAKLYNKVDLIVAESGINMSYNMDNGSSMITGLTKYYEDVKEGFRREGTFERNPLDTSTFPYIEKINACFVYGIYHRTGIELDPSSEADSREAFDDLFQYELENANPSDPQQPSIGYFLGYGNFPTDQFQITWQFSLSPRMSTRQTVKPIKLVTPTAKLIAPPDPTGVTFEGDDLDDVSITEVTYDVSPPEMDEKDVDLPTMPTLDELTGVTEPGKGSFEDRTPTDNPDELTEIEGDSDLGNLVETTPESPGGNDTPIVEKPSEEEAVAPLEPEKLPTAPDDYEETIDQPGNIEGTPLDPTAPSGDVEEEEEVVVTFDDVKEPTVIEPVSPTKVANVEKPVPLTPPTEPVDDPSNPSDPNDPNDPWRPSWPWYPGHPHPWHPWHPWFPRNPEDPSGDEGDVAGGTDTRNNGGGSPGNRTSGAQVTNTKLPSTSNNKGTLPKTNDINNPWYQALGASIIGALGLTGWRKRKKAKADKD